jgi:hypothetical protein
VARVCGALENTLAQQRNMELVDAIALAAAWKGPAGLSISGGWGFDSAAFRAAVDAWRASEAPRGVALVVAAPRRSGSASPPPSEAPVCLRRSRTRSAGNTRTGAASGFGAQRNKDPRSSQIRGSADNRVPVILPAWQDTPHAESMRPPSGASP